MTLREFRDALISRAGPGAAVCATVKAWRYSSGQVAAIWDAWIDPGHSDTLAASGRTGEEALAVLDAAIGEQASADWIGGALDAAQADDSALSEPPAVAP